MMDKYNRGEKSETEMVDRAWELTDSIRVCMMVTWNGERQRARPMSARVRRDEHAIYFLFETGSEKEAEIQQYPMLVLSFADVDANKFVTVNGNAKVTNDRAKIKELWTDFDKAWFSSAEDPVIRLLTVTPEEAELWDSVNKLAATVKMLTAAVTGDKPSMGDNAKVRM